ncbi:MAG TPA: uroporphyrinogen decarboxylase family protein [Bacteroidales bacterium]|nr:uroporphyrinogen decarboxylase family protein [Bacteroidales bacterium]HOX74423.1 uroporphyrinogen decarboxylase family protein [Bacteroidales bacterium]HPM87648.1 uroporphyrinogen decarboxylase family protein [Bacteroidales bacterium]HQM68449.1 uroporphyrinogen decarboxylase family protein [Bacteroidales bacterium]
MTSGSRHNFRETINHRQPEKVVVDFGSTSVTGIHVLIVEKLREYYGLEKRPVRVFEPYQMLGEIDDELIREMGIDVLGIFGENNMFGIRNTGWKVHKTPWGQEVMFPGEFNYSFSAGGDILIHPGGDTSVPPCAVMPGSGYFFDALNRQEPIDESALRVEDNLEEFTEISDHDLQYWKKQAESVSNAGKGIVASLGGTALGDIALVPGLQLKEPKGIRGVEEWYISTVMREDFVKEIFDRQSDIALKNLEKINNAAGNLIDVVFVCGTDFGTQNSTFCSPETFARVWMPYYQKINNWIHQNTGWKTFKHSCGSIDSLMELFIESGFDIINPVQINAAGMDPVMLKKNYGSRITFWGGGVDTQKTFPFGTPAQVKDQVKRQCDILNKDGGFVFNTVHNIQANVPFENVVAMLEALKEL